MNDNASKLLFVNLFVLTCMFVWMSNIIYALLTSQYIYIYIAYRWEILCFIFTLDSFTISLLHLVDYNCSPKCFRA